eukprot:620663_1
MAVTTTTPLCIQASGYIQRVSFLSQLYHERQCHQIGIMPFCSNLSDVLDFLHSLKYVLKQRSITDNCIKRCIEPLIKHQDYFFRAMTGVQYTYIDLQYFPIHNSNEMMAALMYLLYDRDDTNPQLVQLMRESRRQCLKFISNNNEVRELCLESIPTDVFCYLLSFLSPLNVQSLQRVSYSFYSASQRPACYSTLDWRTLWKLVSQFNKSVDDKTKVSFKSVFFAKYALITKLYISEDTMRSSLISNITSFYNKFPNLKELEVSLHSEQSDINYTFQCMICSQYLKDTLTSFEFSPRDEAPLKLSPQILKYIQRFTKLNSLYIAGPIELHDNLQDHEYISDHYCELQSYINHIPHIRINCSYFDETLNALFFSLFFHSNIKSLCLGFGLVGDFWRGVSPVTFVDNIDELKLSGRTLLGLENLKYLEHFKISVDVDEEQESYVYSGLHVWFSWMIASMCSLKSLEISRWNSKMIFGDQMDDNMFYRMIKCNSQTLECITFEMESCGHYGRKRMEYPWAPLFAIHNVMMKASECEYIAHWMRDTFEEYAFCLAINDDAHDIENDDFKINFVPKVQSVIRSLLQLFKRYGIKYSIKLDFSFVWDNVDEDKVINFYANCFKTTESHGNYELIFNTNHALITDFFPVIS